MLARLKQITPDFIFRKLNKDAMARAERGAAKLDSVTPDWFTKVDVAQLDISHGDKCVLGQVYADAAAADPTFDPENSTVFAWAMWHSGFGFDTDQYSSYYGFATTYNRPYRVSRNHRAFTHNGDTLNRAWKILIKQRLKAA